MKIHNSDCTCWNCPALNLKGMVDFRACGQSVHDFKKRMGIEEGQLMAECKRRPELGVFEPNITFERCPDWQIQKYGHMLKKMRVMILGIDGYLGWSLALWLGSLGCKISGVDNFARRRWVKEVGGHSIIPITYMRKRLKIAKQRLGIDIKFVKLDILKDRKRLKAFIQEEQPEAIVHYGECPSAPYSMIDAEHAIEVQRNNVLGTLGLLFSMRNTVPESSLIKLGTLGELGQPLTGRPIFEGIFPGDAILKWRGKEWSLAGELTPRDPGSFYHLSKIHDTYNIMESCKYWWLRSVDVMQGIIYGLHTPGMSQHEDMMTRFDVDEIFGTAINRFVAQAILGIPLTLYGSGEQIRGLIALEDAMQCMTRLICHPPEPGQYTVVNQMSGFHSLHELAETVCRIGKEFNIRVKIQRVENPRVESERHPFNPIYERLPNIYGFSPEVSLEEEIYYMFDILTQPHIKKRLERMKDHILPKTWWSGEHRSVQQVEIL